MSVVTDEASPGQMAPRGRASYYYHAMVVT